MQRLEQFLNRLTDMDWGWWPAVSLRPPKDRDIDNRVLLRLTLLFGPLTGMLLLLEAHVLLLRAGRRPNGAIHIFSFLLGVFVFFFGYKCTFAHFWNRRARRLRAAASPKLPGAGLAA